MELQRLQPTPRQIQILDIFKTYDYPYTYTKALNTLVATWGGDDKTIVISITDETDNQKVYLETFHPDPNQNTLDYVPVSVFPPEPNDFQLSEIWERFSLRLRLTTEKLGAI